jgi:hypothetical protein
MQIGVDSFIAATVDAAGRVVDPARHLSELLEAITLADAVGLDVFGIGEHHRREFLDSAPTGILAAAAARTRRIRLTSAVTVLSAADPCAFSKSSRRSICSRKGGRRSSPGAALSSKHSRSSAWSSRTTILSLPRSSIFF